MNLKSVGITSASIGGNETTLDRLKVNASLRVIDTAQTAGTQLVGLRGDQTTGLWVNVKNTSIPVTGTFFQATQPVSLATNTPDVIDRAARLLGTASVRGLAIAPQSTPFAAAAVGSTAGYDVSGASNVTFIVANMIREVNGSKEVYKIRKLLLNWGFRLGLPNWKLMESEVVIIGCNCPVLG